MGFSVKARGYPVPLPLGRRRRPGHALVWNQIPGLSAFPAVAVDFAALVVLGLDFFLVTAPAGTGKLVASDVARTAVNVPAAKVRNLKEAPMTVL